VWVPCLRSGYNPTRAATRGRPCKYDDAMNMVWHDNEFIYFGWEFL